MTCSCGSDEIIGVNGKCSDMCLVQYQTHEHEGYVPSHLGIGSGDYIRFSFCSTCGKIQSPNFPLENILPFEEY